MTQRICAICKIPFELKAGSIRQTCSVECNGRFIWDRRGRLAVADRFWSKVDKTPGLGPTGECWEWKASRDPKNYGMFSMWDGRTRHCPRAYAVAYELTFGPIPQGMVACHNCDWPPCVRPDPGHVWPDTQQNNIRHAQAVGRFPIAKPQPYTVIDWIDLTACQRSALLKARESAGVSQAGAAALIGYDPSFLSCLERPLEYPTKRKGISRDTVLRLVRLYGIEIESLGIQPDQVRNKTLSKLPPVKPEKDLPVPKKRGRPRKYPQPEHGAAA